jgi:hypothetical protein
MMIWGRLLQSFSAMDAESNPNIPAVGGVEGEFYRGGLQVRGRV